MQQFAYTTGKNATDSAMIIDAMDLLYTGNLDGFCLVSPTATSPSWPRGCASRARPSTGSASRKTPKSLVAACDKFVYLDVLRRSDKSEETAARRRRPPRRPQRKSSKELRGDAKLVGMLREGIDAASDDDGWAHLGGVGSHVAKQAPDFDSRNWGYAKLVDLVDEIGLFEVKRSSGQGVQVREKPKGAASKKAAARS